MRYFFLVLALVFSAQIFAPHFGEIHTIQYAQAQEASPSPSPQAKLPGEIEKAGDLFSDLQKAMADKQGIIMMILAVLFGVAKRVSTEKAVPVVSIVQAIMDKLAYAMGKLGDLLKAIADVLAKVLASDGIFGKK